MKIRRPFRAVVYVAVIIAAMGYVAFSASRQVKANTTVLGHALARGLGRAQSTTIDFSNTFVAWPNGGGWEVRTPALLFMPEDSALSPIAVNVYFDSSIKQAGLWHSIFEVESDTIRFRRNVDGSPFTDDIPRRVILRAISYQQPERIPFTKFEHYASGGSSARRILWLGVIGDLSILAAFGAIIFSLVKLRREIVWSKPGCCTKCDYDLAGLTADKCPECGAAINPGSAT